MGSGESKVGEEKSSSVVSFLGRFRMRDVQCSRRDVAGDSAAVSSAAEDGAARATALAGAGTLVSRIEIESCLVSKHCPTARDFFSTLAYAYRLSAYYLDFGQIFDGNQKPVF